MKSVRIQSVARAFLAVFFLLSVFAYTHQYASAQIFDTCDGDYQNQYTCPASSVATCTDVFGSQYRTVTCYNQGLNGTNVGASYLVDTGCGGQAGQNYATCPASYSGCTSNLCSYNTGGTLGCNCSNYSGSWSNSTYYGDKYCYPATDSYGAPQQCTAINPCGPQSLCPNGGSLGLESTAEYNLGGTSNSYGYAVATDAANDAYVTGEQFDPVNGVDMYVIKYLPNGTKDATWGQSGINTYDVSSSAIDPNTGATITVHGNESGYGIAVDALNDVYVVGRQMDVNGNNSIGFIRKYGPTGSLLWAVPNATDTGITGIARAVAVDSAGNTYTTGEAQSATGDVNLFVSKNDGATGAPVWAVVYGSTNSNETGQGIAVSGSNVYVTGYQKSTNTNTTVALVNSYNTGSGALQWSQTYNSGSGTTLGRGVGTDAAGSVFVTGFQNTGGGDMFLQKYSSAGVPAGGSFPVIYNSGATQNDSGRGVVTGILSRIFVTGSQNTNTGDMFTREYFMGPIGIITPEQLSSLHSFIYNGGATQEIGYGIAIGSVSTIEPAPPVYVTGYSSANGGEMFLNKYSCNAAQTGPTTAASVFASFTVLPGTTGVAPFSVSVDASRSSGNVKKYEWDWDYNGTTFNTLATGIVNSHIYSNNTGGTYTIALRVTTTDNTVDIASIQIVVNPNSPPTASFTVTPASGSAPLTVKADGSASTDPDAAYMPPGYVASFTWDFGDGTAPQTGGSSMTHIYTNKNTPLNPSYTVTLVVTDNGGLQSPPVTQQVTVTDQYMCTPACSGATSVCAANNICTQCTSDPQCGSGYVCKIDKTNAANNTCILGGNSLQSQCWVESIGGCSTNADCTASVEGGVCDTVTKQCDYARCLNSTATVCAKDTDCAQGDGMCNPATNTCDYGYDCAYGPGLGTGVTGKYATSTIPQMPAMPLGVQANGEACTQPTPGAPNNCQGINGCLYYSYNSDGTPVAGSNNSVANCQDKTDGGTGCIYYSNANATAPSDYPCTPGNLCANGAICPASGVCPDKINCLADLTSKKSSGVSNPAGIPLGCFVVDKSKGKKDYDCSAVDGCYYANDGSIDCTYGVTGSVIGNGCLYETNPAGAIFCPGASKAPTAGNNFVQCLLNPNASLPGFVTGTSSSALLPCKTGNDCPLNNICVNGTCFPQCQNNTDCQSGQQCTTPATTCIPGTICPNGAICPLNGICPVTTNCTPGTICPNGAVCPVNGICPGTCTPGTICPNGAVCPVSGVCPVTTCTPGTICPNGAICPLNGICPGTCTPGTICPNGAVCPVNGICPGSCIPGTICPNGAVCPVNAICPGSCIPGTICPNGAVCPVNGICPVTTCTPGTICPNGAICPVNGICPNTTPTCPPGNYYDATYGVCCPNGTMYDSTSGQCTTGTFQSFCQLNPLSPLCNNGGGGPGWTGTTGITSCNVLGITFYNTAITPAGTCDLVAIILALLNWLAWFIGLLAVLSGLRAAYLYITSVGDQKRLTLARSYLIYTAIGVAVAVASYGIVAIARAIFGI